MSWIQTTELLAEQLPGYESRPQQDKLAAAIESALWAKKHILAEGGCGVGKSFAYCVAAYDQALATRAPVVVATATKALQAQLAKKDLPFLQKIFPELTFAVVKGRGNYVCQAKLHGDEGARVTDLAEIQRELDEVPFHSGDIEELITPLRGADKANLTIVGDECPGRKECPFGGGCYAELAKEKAMAVNIVVANHASLIADTQIKKITNGKASMLPHYQRLVIDEAHELESTTTDALSQKITKRGLEILAETVINFLRAPEAGHELRQAAAALFDKLPKMMGDQREDTLRMDDALLSRIAEELGDTWDAANTMLVKIKDYRAKGDDETLAKKRVQRRVESLVRSLAKVSTAGSDEIVRWIERETKQVRGQQEISFRLSYAPLHVGPWLKENLWDHFPTALVSATLTTDDGGDGFSFVAERLGLVGNYGGCNAGSPFDFSKQAVLYTPGRDFPEPSNPTWQAMMIAEAGELIRAAGGRTLLLFTSRRSLEAAYEGLAPTLGALGVTALRQGGDIPNSHLAAIFKTDETSVLFGLKSFMVGADFQGDCCRLVIIDKLPFPVPSDVIYAARAEAIDAVKTSWNTGSFMKLSVPIMILTLLQAFGRAIRTKTDKAAVVIFDSRLSTKGYGRGIMRSMPDAQRTHTLAEAQEFLRAC